MTSCTGAPMKVMRNPGQGQFRGPAAALLVLCLLAPSAARAYRRHLSEEDVREAYFLGQRHDARRGEFFTRYERAFPAPSEPGEYMSAVAVRTPYALAVLRSAAAHGHYTAQQAWQDYRADADRFEVVVWMDYSYGNKSGEKSETPVTNDSRRGFFMEVKQVRNNEERTLVPRESYSEYGADVIDTFLPSFHLHGEYRLADIDSSELKVEATIPSGKKVTVTFNLEELR
jgi:hypothetical protein